MISTNQKVVSVIVLVYNHENYIEQCLKSLFEQKVNFDVEYIIGDDCSSDRTEDIIREFIKQYPHLIIRYTRNDVNQGLMKNYKHLFDNCKGKYVASCAGDDYWLSEHKLQKQFDYLEANPEFICSTTDTLYLEGDQYRPYSYVETKASWLSEKVNNDFSFQQLANRFFPHPNTMFFRNQGDLPNYFLDFMCEDYPLFLLLSTRGKIHYFKEKMTAYRIHEASYVQSKNEIDKNQMYSLLFLKIQFRMINELGKEYSSRMAVAIENEILRLMLKHHSDNIFLKKLYKDIQDQDTNQLLQLKKNWERWIKKVRITVLKNRIKNLVRKLK